MYVQTPALDGSHDVRSATTAENGAEEEHSLVPVLYRSYKKNMTAWTEVLCRMS